MKFCLRVTGEMEAVNGRDMSNMSIEIGYILNYSVMTALPYDPLDLIFSLLRPFRAMVTRGVLREIVNWRLLL